MILIVLLQKHNRSTCHVWNFSIFLRSLPALLYHVKNKEGLWGLYSIN